VTDEGERTVDREVESDATADRARSRSVDEAAVSFLNLEAQLRSASGATVRGRAVDVEKVPAADVPDRYPVEITTAEALALRLVVDAADEREVVVYFAWDDGEADDRLGRLLALHDIPQHRFADLHGESILLEYDDGYYLPYVPAEGVRGSAAGVYGVAAGLGVNLLALLLVVVGLGDLLSSLAVIVGLLAVNVFLMPIATYLDGWYLRTQTDWGQGPAFWALLAMIPGLNILTALRYLNSRRNATPLVD
jgi:hypothetical protein